MTKVKVGYGAFQHIEDVGASKLDEVCVAEVDADFHPRQGHDNETCPKYGLGAENRLEHEIPDPSWIARFIHLDCAEFQSRRYTLGSWSTYWPLVDRCVRSMTGTQLWKLVLAPSLVVVLHDQERVQR